MKRVLLALAVLAAPGAASAQVPTGPDFQVNSYTTGNQYLPRIAVGRDGSYVVVWTSDGQDGSAFGAFGRRFDPADMPRGLEFRINSYTTGNQGLPSVAIGGRGDFVIVWVDEQGNESIRARRYHPSGAPFGDEFQVETFTTGTQYRPEVAVAANSRFVVSWASEGRDGSNYGIAAQPFGHGGYPLAAEIVVNSYTTGNQVFPDVASDPVGNFVVVWEDRAPNRDGSGSGIFGQRFNHFGTRLGGEFQVNTYTTGDQRQPSVSVSSGSDFVVAWSGPDGSLEGVSARRFNAQGAPIGNEFVVSTNTFLTQYILFDAVTHDEGGNFLIAWHGTGGGRLFAQRFDAAGNRRGGEFDVNSYTTGLRHASAVRSDAVGNFVATWGDLSGADGSLAGIFARRFGGLRPRALTIMDGGNGVLEVPDDFTLVTAWQNISGAVQTFQGQASQFTGPPGLIYVLGSTTATYGTVADGGIGLCTGSCISGSLLGARPSGHVDVSVREKIVPDLQGQDQRWVLHVGGSFTDVPASNPFYRFIETLVHRNVTGGCTPTTYCPGSPTTREQMALFVLLAKEGTGYIPPSCTTPMFNDVQPTSAFCRWIEELARRGVVTGCGGGNYCPFNAVTREQMPVFVLRTLDPALVPPPCAPPNIYNDVAETSPFCPWIEELTRRNVVTGCGGGNYCPTAWVTREQMGVFISVTFGLTLYGP